MALNIGKEVAALERMTVGEFARKIRGTVRRNDASSQPHVACPPHRLANAVARGGRPIRTRASGKQTNWLTAPDLRVTAPRESKLSPDAADRTKTMACRIEGNSRVPLPGTVITRRYKGRLIQVTVVTDGFEFEGELFKSLSAVAKRVTGSHWNGYKFFNLNNEGESR